MAVLELKNNRGKKLNGGPSVMLLALAERGRKVAATLTALIADRRDPSRITHAVADVLRARMLAIVASISTAPSVQRMVPAS
jgi:hypothetical protein